jgi:hypothetical protein
VNEVFRYQTEADNQGRANDADARRRAAEADRNAARFSLLAPSQLGSSLGLKLLE